MKILITGATGLVGSRVCQKLDQKGADLIIVSRSPEAALEKLTFDRQTYVSWDELYGHRSAELLSGLSSVINLAGEPLVEGRWTTEKMKRIDESRGLATEKLIDHLRSVGVSLESFISASAMGIYGSRGDEILHESSASGQGFLAEVCKKWEAPVLNQASQVSKRQVILRISLVLSDRGGFLGELLPIFRKGIGGPIADGKAWMSWIHQDDLVGVIVQSLTDDRFSGPLNVSVPEAVTNSVMTRSLGKALGVPAVIPVPSFGLQLLFGKKAEMLLASTRLRPQKLEEANFDYQYTDLGKALESLIF